MKIFKKKKKKNRKKKKNPENFDNLIPNVKCNLIG
jgi:hypothetical protein